MSDLAKYTFTMTSEQELIAFDDNLTIRAYPKILFSDSILDFYPSLEVYVRDKQAVLSEKLFFIEGLSIKVKLGRNEETTTADAKKDTLGGYLVNNYVWVTHDINQTEIKDHISGDYIFLLVPYLYIKDSADTKAYKNKISNIVRLVLKEKQGYNFIPIESGDSKNCFIEETTDLQTTFYQAGRLGRFLLKTLAGRAVSKNFSNSPFYTFLNNKGEFYFMSVSGMLKENSVCTYRIEETPESVRDPYVIKGYTVQSGGALINKKNYNKKFYKIKSDGTVDPETIKIADMKQAVHGIVGESSQKDKLLIYTNGELGVTENISSIDNYGIYDNNEDTDVYKGWKNNLYLDAILPYRMDALVTFNPKLCAGKCITITVGKLQEQTFATEFSGKWLIITSKVHMDIEGFPVMNLLIGKPGIAIDSRHPAINNFI